MTLLSYLDNRYVTALDRPIVGDSLDCRISYLVVVPGSRTWYSYLLCPSPQRAETLRALEVRSFPPHNHIIT